MSADALAEAELKLTDAALTFARQAQTGRISFTRVGNDISFHPVAPEPADVLAKLAGTDDAAKTLDSFNPPQPEFKALREKLAELRNGGDQAKPEVKAPPQVRIAEGKILRPGMKDDRVIALRDRRGAQLAMLVISHDIGSLAAMSDRLVVLHRGRIVEDGPTRRVVAQPQHPYTRLLIDSVPVIDTPRPNRPAPLTRS